MSAWSQDPDPAVPGQPLKLCLTDMGAIPGSFTANFGAAGSEDFQILEVGHPCATITVPAGAVAGVVVDGNGVLADYQIRF